MDEPTAGLDPVIRREVLDILYNVIQDEKKSIFFSTHITTDLEKIADYITYIKDGKLVFSKTMEEVMESYALIKGGPDQLNDEIKKNIMGLRETNVGFEALTDNPREIRNILGADILIERPTLEDIMYYTRGE
jgi:ABC-2 type transport system ATP-binding protein